MNSCIYAHNHWKKILTPNSIVIDATLGNGYDTLFLAQCLQGHGTIYGFDIQIQALHKANKLFINMLTEQERSNIYLICASHENFCISEADLIVYNLGYLPGGDKNITTRADSTLKSLIQACSIVKKAISVLCYIGHEEGILEFNQVSSFFKSLSSKEFLVCHHTWVNRKNAPTFFWCEKLP